MSVTIRTNLCDNPFPASTSGWAWQTGTGESSSYSLSTDPGPDLQDGFLRRTITTGKSGGNSGAYRNESVSGGAGDDYSSVIWVRSSVAITCALNVTAKSDSGSTTVTAEAGASVALVADEWTELSTVLSDITGSYDTVQSWVIFNSAQILPSGATFDVARYVLETGTTPGAYFDGSTPDGAGVVYAWTGTEDASTSTATAYQPVISVEALTDAPCPRAEITITDLDPAENTITVWRTSDGVRRPVRSARRWTVIGSDAVVDYEVPLARTVTYELEIIEGISAQVPVDSGDVVVDSESGWIQDPLDPSTGVALYSDVGPGGEPSLGVEAVKNLEYAADISLIPILGQADPVALIGQRMSASNVAFDMFTDAAQQSTTLRNLLRQASPVLVRPLPGWAQALPGLCYVASAKVVEIPVNEAWGGQIIQWQMTGDLVQGPTFNIIVAVTTYGDVQALWDTYQAAQTVLAGNTYLDVKKNPSGA